MEEHDRWWWEDEREELFKKYGYQNVTENVICDSTPSWSQFPSWLHCLDDNTVGFLPPEFSITLQQVPPDEVWYKPTKVIANEPLDKDMVIGQITGELITRERLNVRVQKMRTNGTVQDAAYVFPMHPRPETDALSL